MVRDAASAHEAFERAVAREREAIKRHEAAAVHQDAIASQLEQQALNDKDDLSHDAALDSAAHARRRAQLARDRAATARARLRDEGIDPDLDGAGTATPVVD